MSKVIYYTTASGDSPPKDFIASLSKSQSSKVLRVLTYIGEYGLVTAIRHVKKLAGTPLWEIRVLGRDSIRVLYATEEEATIIVLHGFIKKTPKTPLREIETALDRLNKWRNPRKN